jgi:peptidoglycan hydrolase-like protein with peptidoglycan-binding domain
MTKQGCVWFRAVAAGWVLVLGGCAAPADQPRASEPPIAPVPAAPPPDAASPATAAPQPASLAPEAAPQAAAPMSGKELQEVLTALGYKPGRIDGKPGPRTREALKLFQKDAGLPATGVLDAETTQRLRAAPPRR